MSRRFWRFKGGVCWWLGWSWWRSSPWSVLVWGRTGWWTLPVFDATRFRSIHKLWPSACRSRFQLRSRSWDRSWDSSRLLPTGNPPRSRCIGFIYTAALHSRSPWSHSRVRAGSLSVLISVRCSSSLLPSCIWRAGSFWEYWEPWSAVGFLVWGWGARAVG